MIIKQDDQFREKSININIKKFKIFLSMNRLNDN